MVKGGVMTDVTRKLSITPNEVKAFKDAADTLRGMAGGGDQFFDDEARRVAKRCDNFLKRNNLAKRDYS